MRSLVSFFVPTGQTDVPRHIAAYPEPLACAAAPRTSVLALPLLLLWSLFQGAPAALLGQPAVVYPRRVLNAASFASPGLPHGSIARGSVFSIFGAGIGPTSSPTLAFPLAITLGGVSIRVFQGTTSVNAIPVFVGPTQINAIMPSNAPLGRVSLQVTFNNFSSNPAPVTIVNSTFGIYTATGYGLGPGILQDNNLPGVPINAPSVAAMPGDTITLWGTGLGPVTFPDNLAPTAVSLPTQTEVFVGGKPAAISYNGRAPCCSGSDQINFVVPADAPLGCWVPVFVRTEGRIVSNSVTMAISADGSPCSESSNPFAVAILSGGKLGVIDLRRSMVHDDFVTATPIDYTTDVSFLSFRQLNGGPYAFDPGLSLPPAGTCTVYTATGDLRAIRSVPIIPTTKRRLDAGSTFTVTGPSASRLITFYRPPGPDVAQLGKNIPGSGLRNSLLLVPGAYNISGKGGADVGPIQATVNNPPALTWTNQGQINTIDRTQPLTLTWTGATAGQPVQVFGGNADKPTNSGAAFLCVAPADATSFTVPPYILSNVPASNPLQRITSGGFLSVGAGSGPSTFSAGGLDAGVASVQSFAGKTVTFK